MGGVITAADREHREQVLREYEARQRQRATDLATKLVRHLNRIVIRPGPKPEERECTQVAAELESQIPQLANIILSEGSTNG